ncbi:MAG: carboxylesterase/lipase family protein [Acidimicrobiales bacterium]
MTPRAQLTNGVVEGTTEDGLAVFRGMPFAKPPFGPLRFQRPEPPDPWEGVRPATAFGPPPPQTGHLFRTDDPLAEADPAPDCLHVSVWSPDLAGSLPVMVWIYGGAYLVGSADQPVYDGATLARGGVVVVTFNHRVGAEGFASLDGAPDNRGLLDQVAALRWVQENIAAFGGDPARVTVFGQSAGASSVAALLAMPAARGLFRRGILQSVPGTFFSPRLGRDVSTRIAAQLGLSPTASDFATRRPDEIGEAVVKVQAAMPELVDRWGRVARTITPFSPIVGGETLPTAPWDALAAGASSDVEIVAGFMREEYRVFHTLDGTLARADDADATYMVDLLGPDDAGTGTRGDPASDYRAAYPEKSPGELIEVAFTDWLFRMATLRLAEQHVAGGGRAFVYEIALPAPAQGGAFGACHGFDLPLTFGNLENLGADFTAALLGDDPPSASVRRASEAIRTAWTAFAKTGDPGWAPLDVARGNARVFGEEPVDTDGLEQRSTALWARHRFAEMDLVGD